MAEFDEFRREPNERFVSPNDLPSPDDFIIGSDSDVPKDRAGSYLDSDNTVGIDGEDTAALAKAVEPDYVAGIEPASWQGLEEVLPIDENDIDDTGDTDTATDDVTAKDSLSDYKTVSHGIVLSDRVREFLAKEGARMAEEMLARVPQRDGHSADDKQNTSDNDKPDEPSVGPSGREPIEPLPPLTELLPFVVPHDGTQPEVLPAEQAVVAEKFDAMVDDTHLNFAGDVKHSNVIVTEDRLLLRTPASNNAYWRVTVTARTNFDSAVDPDLFTPADIIKKAITLTYRVDDRDRYSCKYRLCADDVVRRWTGPDQALEAQKRREAGIEDPNFKLKTRNPEEVRQEAREALAGLPNLLENRELERRMGHQNGPIGLDELYGLADLLDQAEEVDRDPYWP